MVDIKIDTFWQNNVAPSSETWASKETLGEARAFAQAQATHYNAQGFTVAWAIFENHERKEWLSNWNAGKSCSTIATLRRTSRTAFDMGISKS